MKKPTTLSVLIEIRDLLKAQQSQFVTKIEENKNSITVTFPQKTAKEMVDECNNTIETGNLIWSSWMLKENFYTKELPRKGKVTINLELLHKGKSWNECANSVLGVMLSFPEVVYLVKTNAEVQELLKYNWTWTTSLSAFSGVVGLGSFDEGGLFVGDNEPGLRLGNLGCLLVKNS